MRPEEPGVSLVESQEVLFGEILDILEDSLKDLRDSDGRVNSYMSRESLTVWIIIVSVTSCIGPGEIRITAVVKILLHNALVKLLSGIYLCHS